MEYLRFIHMIYEPIVFLIKLMMIILTSIFILGIFSIKEKIVPYTVTSNKINNDLKIVLITDLHSCYYGDNMNTLIEDIKSQNPDLVLLGGDIYNDKKSDNANTETFLKQISSISKCYFVTGNHDSKTETLKNTQEVKKATEKYGLTILDGIYDTLEINGQKINICGVDDPTIAKNSFYNQLDNTGKACDNGNFSILLSHRPELIDKYRKYDFDLVLSGHAHGGQWRIPKLINGIIAPHQGLFPKYAGGRYDFKDSTLIVSRGLARESTPVPRIFNNPEVVVINITSI